VKGYVTILEIKYGTFFGIKLLNENRYKKKFYSIIVYTIKIPIKNRRSTRLPTN